MIEASYLEPLYHVTAYSEDGYVPEKGDALLDIRKNVEYTGWRKR
jgi:hypothetical protein